MAEREINLSENIENFGRTLGEAAQILTLGRALSLSSPAVLSTRIDAGFLIGDVRPVTVPGQQPIAIAEADGRIGNDFPAENLRDAALLHAAVLQAKPKAGAVISMRAPRLAAWGLSRRPLPVRYFQMFGYTRAQEIPVSAADPRAVAETLAALGDVPALLLSDGRTLIWAPQPQRAVRLVLSLEEAAHVTALADHLGGAVDYPAEARNKIYESLQAQARR